MRGLIGTEPFSSKQLRLFAVTATISAGGCRLPSIDEWEMALAFERVVEIEANQTLADQVNALTGSASFSNSPKKAIPVAAGTMPTQFLVAPGELLFSIGRVTDPRIDNLADIASTWARLRYLWAFEPSAAGFGLCLSGPAMTIGYHQRALLSDEVGCGMAHLIANRYFGATGPAIDAEAALDGFAPFPVERQYSTAPDYIFTREGSADASPRYLVVEAKGTRSGRKNSLSQLRRGLEQLPSLIFSAGGDVLRLVVGTCLSTAGTRVLVIDPPEDVVPRVEKPGRTRLHFERLDHLKAASLLRYAGLPGQADEFDRPPEAHMPRYLRSRHPEDGPKALERIDEVKATFVGSTQEVRFAGNANRVVLFRGILED